MAWRIRFAGALLLLAVAGPIFSSALVLPTHTSTTTASSTSTATTTKTTTTTTATASPSSEDTDEPFTTKRNANLYFDLPKQTQFPLPVENAEKKTTNSKVEVAKVKVTTTIKPSEPPRRGTNEMPLYRLNGSNGQACILLQVDALITIKYRSTLKEDEEVDVYIPGNALVTGNCEDENLVTMSLKWNTYILTWTFAKTPGGERWYVDKIEMIYNSGDKHFQHTDEPNKTIRVSTGQKHSSMLFPTPVGKSYTCDEQEIALTDGKHHASVLLRQMKLQPFKFKSNDFAAEFSCSALSARINRDETAPVAVGSTLAAVVLLTITGYAGWRHFKIKKVNYDTME